MKLKEEKHGNEMCKNTFSVIEDLFPNYKCLIISLAFIVLDLLLARQGYKKRSRQKGITYCLTLTKSDPRFTIYFALKKTTKGFSLPCYIRKPLSSQAGPFQSMGHYQII